MASNVFENFTYTVNGKELSFVGTSADDKLDLWVAIQRTSFNYYSVDGAGGSDKVSFGTSERNKFKITQNSDGIVHVDSISGASSAVHVTLKNVETLVFGNDSDVYELSGAPTPPTPPAIHTIAPLLLMKNKLKLM